MVSQICQTRIPRPPERLFLHRSNTSKTSHSAHCRSKKCHTCRLCARRCLCHKSTTPAHTSSGGNGAVPALSAPRTACVSCLCAVPGSTTSANYREIWPCTNTNKSEAAAGPDHLTNTMLALPDASPCSPVPNPPPQLCRSQRRDMLVEPVELQVQFINLVFTRLLFILWYAVLIIAFVIDLIPRAQWGMDNICGTAFPVNLRHATRWSSPCVTEAANIPPTSQVAWTGPAPPNLLSRLERFSRIAVSLPTPANMPSRKMSYGVQTQVTLTGSTYVEVVEYSVRITCYTGRPRCQLYRVPLDALFDDTLVTVQFALLNAPAAMRQAIASRPSAVGIAYQRRGYTVAVLVLRYFFLVFSVLHTIRFIAHWHYTNHMYEQRWVLVLQFTLVWYLNPLNAVVLSSRPLSSVLAFIEYRIPAFMAAVIVGFMFSIIASSMPWTAASSSCCASQRCGGGASAGNEGKGGSNWLCRQAHPHDAPFWSKLIAALYVLAMALYIILGAALTQSWQSPSNSDKPNAEFWVLYSLLLAGAAVCLVMLLLLRHRLALRPYLESRPQQLAFRMFVTLFFGVVIYTVVHYIIFIIYYNRQRPALYSYQPLIQLQVYLVITTFVNILTFAYTRVSFNNRVPVRADDARWRHMVWPHAWYRWLARHGGSHYIFFTEQEEVDFYNLQFEFRQRKWMIGCRQRQRAQQAAKDDTVTGEKIAEVTTTPAAAAVASVGEAIQGNRRSQKDAHEHDKLQCEMSMSHTNETGAECSVRLTSAMTRQLSAELQRAFSGMCYTSHVRHWANKTNATAAPPRDVGSVSSQRKRPTVAERREQTILCYAAGQPQRHMRFVWRELAARGVMMSLKSKQFAARRTIREMIAPVGPCSTASVVAPARIAMHTTIGHDTDANTSCGSGANVCRLTSCAATEPIYFDVNRRHNSSGRTNMDTARLTCDAVSNSNNNASRSSGSDAQDRVRTLNARLFAWVNEANEHSAAIQEILNAHDNGSTAMIDASQLDSSAEVRMDGVQTSSHSHAMMCAELRRADSNICDSANNVNNINSNIRCGSVAHGESCPNCTFSYRAVDNEARGAGQNDGSRSIMSPSAYSCDNVSDAGTRPLCEASTTRAFPVDGCGVPCARPGSDQVACNGTSRSCASRSSASLRAQAHSSPWLVRLNGNNDRNNNDDDTNSVDAKDFCTTDLQQNICNEHSSNCTHDRVESNNITPARISVTFCSCVDSPLRPTQQQQRLEDESHTCATPFCTQHFPEFLPPRQCCARRRRRCCLIRFWHRLLRGVAVLLRVLYDAFVVVPHRLLRHCGLGVFDASYNPFHHLDYLPFFNVETAIDCLNLSWEAYAAVPTQPANQRGSQSAVHAAASPNPCSGCSTTVNNHTDNTAPQAEKPDKHRHTLAKTISSFCTVLGGCIDACCCQRLPGLNLYQNEDYTVYAQEHERTAHDGSTEAAVIGEDDAANVEKEADDDAAATVHPGSDAVQPTSSPVAQAALVSPSDASTHSSSWYDNAEAPNNNKSGSGSNARLKGEREMNMGRYGYTTALVYEAAAVQMIMSKMNLLVPQHAHKAARIVIAFRGTANKLNMRYDVHFVREPWHEMMQAEQQHEAYELCMQSCRNSSHPHCPYGSSGKKKRDEYKHAYCGCWCCSAAFCCAPCRSCGCCLPQNRRPTVHSGFLAVWKAHQTVVLRQLYEMLVADRQTCYRIFTTGHSLGGAVASLCAYSITRMLLSMNYPVPECTVYTFGQPRIGNRVFQRYYNRAVPRTFRVMNERDVVMSLNGFGAHHIGIEVDIDRNGNYVVNPNIIERLLRPTRGRGFSVAHHHLRSYAVSLNALAMNTTCCAQAFRAYRKSLIPAELHDDTETAIIRS